MKYLLENRETDKGSFQEGSEMVANQSTRYFSKLDEVAEEVISLLSDTMDVNTIFLASNDKYSNFIVKAFNRKATLLRSGESTPFKDVLCKLVVDNESQPIVISDLSSHPMTINHPVTLNVKTGCFMGAPIYQGNGEIYGTICAFDTKPYNFSSYDVKLIKTLSSLLSQTLILEDLMVHDHLTGLYNNFYLREFFQQEMNEGKAYNLLYIDLDNFKEVNDQYGHHIGDELLKKVAALFKKLVPNNSVSVRIGGDEFVILIPVVSNEMNEPLETANHILKALTDDKIEVNELILHITASIGMTFAEPGKELEILLKEADSAMYQAKSNGRNKLKIHQKNENPA